jgi:hypothetical protein
LYNLLHVLEDEETEDTKMKIQQLGVKIDQYVTKSFPIKDGTNDRAELGAHGYEVEPQVIEDKSGFVIESFSKVRQALSAYATR